MSIGFRKSIFGFNRSDVIEYIEKLQSSFEVKAEDDSLNITAQELADKLAVAETEIRRLTSEKQEMEEKYKDYQEKYEQIARLSEDIGKLYLVAKSNAKAIMENSENSAVLVANEVDKNLQTIETAQESLSEFKSIIEKTSNLFGAEVDKILSSLSATKEKISENARSLAFAKAEFYELYQSAEE